MKKSLNITTLFLGTVILFAACGSPNNIATADNPPELTNKPTEDTMDGMDMDNMGVDSSMSADDFAPLVGGIYENGEVLFIHTKSSDPEVANLLTEMMGGVIVVLVPELANTPSELLAKVFVFTNGIEGFGPFGFQQDIFDSVPGDEGYRPLRALNLVEWISGVEPLELRTMADLLSAEANGDVMITESGIVVNMPILSWPDGHR